jgi:hypothetical protein
MNNSEIRALPDELELGDFVSWKASGGQAYGRIVEIRASH